VFRYYFRKEKNTGDFILLNIKCVNSNDFLLRDLLKNPAFVKKAGDISYGMNRFCILTLSGKKNVWIVFYGSPVKGFKGAEQRVMDF
jgi:hypothetical protein